MIAGDLKKKTKRLAGIVVSNKMAKTAVVEVTRFVKHAKYQKFMKISKRFKADDTIGHAVGDRVIIEECRPISKDKHFRIVK